MSGSNTGHIFNKETQRWGVTLQKARSAIGQSLWIHVNGTLQVDGLSLYETVLLANQLVRFPTNSEIP